MSRLMNHRFLGLVFIGLIVLGLWFVNALFTQKFSSFDEVTLSAKTVGLQLPARADVKVRGVLVGEVVKTESQVDTAKVTLGIDPDKIGTIPDNVTASILPKTLFGEKYIELNIPESASSTPLRAGDRIEQTKLPIEVEKVLNDLYPLLTTLQPAELNYTLNALSTALEGRGEKIAQGVNTLDDYLRRTNPQVPALIEDIKLLSQVSDTYADVMPSLAATLRNTVKTGNTLVEKEAKLSRFLHDTSTFAATTKSFLDDNGDNIVALGRVSEPTLALLRRYSPTYPCLLRGLVRQVPRLASTFRGFIFHINLETVRDQPRGYGPQDRPKLGANLGPNCAGLPNPPGSQANPYGGKNSPIKVPNFDDGVNGLQRGDNQRPATGFATTSTFGGTEEARSVLDSLAATALGIRVDQVPGVSSLLFGPAVAGSVVSER